MFKLNFCLVFGCLIVVIGLCASRRTYNSRTRRQATNMRYILSSGSELIVGAIREEFSCEGREYGYYADIANNCQVFHICMPPSGHYTFFCGNQTIFDQRLLTCQDVRRATPCELAEQYFVLNQNFGLLDQDQYVRV